MTDTSEAPVDAPAGETPSNEPRPEPTFDELKSILDELGLAPGQLKGRLEASKKNEIRAKENADKARRFDELEEANKSEQQKLADAAELARKEAAETATELAKLRAAVKHGLTDDDLELLGTGTPEEIESRAERLASRLKSAAPAPPSPSAAGQGKVGAPLVSADQDIDAAIDAASKSRNFPLVATLKAQKAALEKQKG